MLDDEIAALLFMWTVFLVGIILFVGIAASVPPGQDRWVCHQVNPTTNSCAWEWVATP